MKKRILALFLSLSFCVPLLPAALAEGETTMTYNEAVAELRSKTGHSNEQTIETDDCTIFIFDRGGFMNAPKGMMVLIYKPGSQLGEGTTIELPHARTQGLNVVTHADTMELSADRKTFTYTYRVKEPIKVGNQVVQEAGIYTYVANLPTGEVTESHTPLSTDGTYLISITTADGVVTSGYRTEWRWVALSRSDPGRPGILLRGSDADVTGSLQRSNGLTVGDDLDAWGKAQDGKPATLTLGKESWECTARYKDYGYQSVLYVEFPPYDAEGSHQPDSDTIDLFRYDWAQKAAKTYDQAVAELQSEDGYATEQTFESDYGTVFLYNHGPNPHAQHGFLAFVTKAPCAKGAGKIIGLPQTRNSLFCLVKPPHAMALSEDGKTFTYSYHYDDPVLSIEYKILRPAGDYSYVLDLTTGNVTKNYTPLGYEKTLARLMEGSENEKVAQVVEGPAATAVLWYQDFHADEYNRGGYQSYYLYLVFKDDNAPEAFRRLLLPSTEYLTVGGWAPTNRAPDSMAFSEDGKTLTYTYVFDAPLSHGDTVYHEVGIYTYTVDAATGELTVSYSDGTEAPTQSEASSVGTFTDVPAGSWYESGIKLCAEKGIMIGMGDGTFGPDKTLTAAECLTLALRLYDLCHGGAGVIEKAPEDWNRITITAADGTTVTGKPEEPFQYQGRGAKGLNTEGIWYAVQPGQEAAAQALDGTAATVTIHGKDYPATLSYSTRSYIDGTSENILFAAYTGDNSSIYHAFAVTTNHCWWVDSAAMVQKLGLYDWTSDESNGFRDLYVTAASGAEATARRAQFADSLATATGSLPVLQENVTIPDLGIPEQGVATAYGNILMLYRAGILNGKDETGNFDYYGQLTRAEAATMVARIMDKSLRVMAEP